MVAGTPGSPPPPVSLIPWRRRAALQVPGGGSGARSRRAADRGAPCPDAGRARTPQGGRRGMSDIEDRLAEIRSRGLYRRLRVVSGPQGPRVLLDGTPVLLLCSNNY